MDALNSVQESSEPGLAALQQWLLWLSPHSSLHRVYGGIWIIPISQRQKLRTEKLGCLPKGTVRCLGLTSRPA